MDKPDLTVEEVMELIKRTLSAEKVKTPTTGDNSIDDLKPDELSELLSSLGAEVQNNNLKWNITGDLPITSHRRILGPFIIFGKKIVRGMLSWYIGPILSKQTDFNASVTKSINLLNQLSCLAIKDQYDLKIRIDSIANKTELHNKQLKIEEKDIKQLSKQVDSELAMIADHIRRIDRQLSNYHTMEQTPLNAEAMVKKDKEVYPDINYFLFEQRFRGDRAIIKERQKVYLQYYLDKKNVLDIGCGRGEFIELLSENGINVTGIDLDNDMVELCKNIGLPAIRIDAIKYLSSLEDNSLDGIFSAQVVEHLTSEDMLQLINLCYKKLKPSGVIIFETINPQNLVAISNWFYMDLSHIRPVHPITLKFIFESVGFKDADLIYLHPNNDEKIPMLNNSIENAEKFNAAIERINNLLFGPQDYALKAIR